MILLIAGTDDFRIQERLKQIKKNYDVLSVSVFKDSLVFEKIKQEFSVVSFFSSEKLVILHDVGKIKDKQFQKKLTEWLKTFDSKDSLVLIEDDSKVPAWLSGSLRSNGKIEIYNPLRPHEVIRWIRDRVTLKGGEIDVIGAEKIAEMLGNDLWRISNEIDKLIAYDSRITVTNIEKMIEPEFLDSIFTLLGAIAEKKEKKALSVMNSFTKEEDNEPYLISMITRQVRNLISVKDLASMGKKESEIASKLKIHPFVVRNTLRQSRLLSFEQLLAFHEELLEANLEIKTSSDSKTTLFRLVHTFCSK